MVRQASAYLPAAARALERFPIEPENIELVAHSENVTFRVTAKGSAMDYALRLHRPGYNSLEELDSERTWAKALADAGIVVQGSLPSTRGRNFELIDIPETGEERYAGVTTWLDGTPLSDYLDANADDALRTRLFRTIGEIAATIHDQSSSWRVPKGFTRPRLDIDGLLGEAPRWGRFWEHAALTPSERALLLEARRKVAAMLETYGETPDTFSLVHADLHPANLVYDGESLALIDFDDSAFGWHGYDIASALIEYRSAADYPVLEAALLEGYRGRRPLADRDVDMLPVFLLIRGMALIGWFHQRPEHAGSDFFTEVKQRLIDDCRQLIGDGATGGADRRLNRLPGFRT